ncbi:putative membrane protein YgcG [Saccharomonospora amisosensis]|uniref:Putative membrane protein YgcG n=2 Tax=Saccharomonospora amisosensis TaxID=1128677 RepID=A0A7X5USH8_9PSEU|nr:putative membrane protein YgcG [Saccharomonospora amisosensis]
MYEPSGPSGPFSTRQLARLDEALTLASRETGLDFSIYLGELGDDSRAQAESLHTRLGDSADNAVLIAVSPGQRVIEVVTGTEAMYRLPDRGAKLAVMSMVASFKEGDLIGGLVSGLRMMADQAGSDPRG